MKRHGSRTPWLLVASILVGGVNAQAGRRVLGEHRHLSCAAVLLPLNVATASAHVSAAPV